MFENGHTSVTDAERYGCTATATTTRNEGRTLEMIRENRRITVEEVAGRLNVSVGSAYSLIHDSLKFSEVCARWVPKELTEEHTRKHLDICSQHLACYREEGDNFLQQIVTRDETWIHHYEPESKQCAMECAMEASIISCSKEIQDATVGRKFDVEHLLGLSRANSRNLSGTWNKLSQVQRTVTCFREK